MPEPAERDALIARAAERYASGAAERTELYDTSHGADDIRYTAVYRHADGGRFVLHVTKNDFTTPERVAGWAALERHYNSLGVYAPQTLMTASGELAFAPDGFVCYAEEFARGNMQGNLSTNSLRDWRTEPYGADALATLGLLAVNPAPAVPWCTAWCIYDKFAESDPCDERLMYALGLVVWQGDVANFLVDDNGNFAGVYDFNLSGSDTVLNYIFSETRSTLYDFGKRSAATILDRSEWDTHDERMARFIALACRHYKFSDAEKRAWSTYYRIAYPFFQQNMAFWADNLAESGELYADTILTWIERQMARTDAGILLP